MVWNQVSHLHLHVRRQHRFGWFKRSSLIEGHLTKHVMLSFKLYLTDLVKGHSCQILLSKQTFFKKQGKVSIRID